MAYLYIPTCIKNNPLNRTPIHHTIVLQVIWHTFIFLLLYRITHGRGHQYTILQYYKYLQIPIYAYLFIEKSLQEDTSSPNHGIISWVYWCPHLGVFLYKAKHIWVSVVLVILQYGGLVSAFLGYFKSRQGYIHILVSISTYNTIVWCIGVLSHRLFHLQVGIYRYVMVLIILQYGVLVSSSMGYSTYRQGYIHMLQYL